MPISSDANTPLAARKAGVRTARDGTGGERGEPQKILGVVKAEVVFVFYNDEKGQPQQAMYFKVGDQIMSTKDTTVWCKNLYPMNDWMRKQFDDHERRAVAVDMPSSDAVDLLTNDAVDVLDR